MARQQLQGCLCAWFQRSAVVLCVCERERERGGGGEGRLIKIQENCIIYYNIFVYKE